MKGQASIELVATVGIALVIATPFVLEAQRTMIDVELGSETAELQASLDKLAEAVRDVGSMSEYSTKTVEMRLSRDMDNFTVSNDRAIIYSEEVSGRVVNYTRIFDTKVDASNMPQNQGIYTIEVKAWQDQVNISRVN